MYIPKTRQEAKNIRSPHYYGSPCQYGHEGAIRYTANGNCSVCLKEHANLTKLQKLERVVARLREFANAV